MALQFHPLPLDVFPDEARPAIGRFNHELRQLFGLESVLRNPITSQRSDLSIVRRNDVQVDVSRITPTITSGSTSSGAPVDATFLTISANATLTAERSIVVSSPLTSADAGANSTYTLGISTSALAGLLVPLVAGTPAILYGTTYVDGVASTFVRTDATLKFPNALMSTANSSLLTLTDDAIDMTATASLGSLIISAPVGVNIQLGPSTSGSFVVKPNSTTSAPTAASIQGRPVAGSRTLLAPSWFTPSASDIFASQNFRTWDAQITSFAGQHTSCTFVQYDTSAYTLAPSVGSGSGNNAYDFRGRLSISNTNATWAEVATGHMIGMRRSVSSPTITTLATYIIEVPTGAVDASGDQIGLIVRPQSSLQLAPTNWVGFDILAATNGTNRYSGRAANTVRISNPSGISQSALELRQLNVGATAGAHINFQDKAGDPPAPVAGDVWRNGDGLWFRQAAANVDLTLGGSGGGASLGLIEATAHNFNLN